ncbi:223_t:CDS:2 [Scutellospora calospora]|uniref:223_t:CDS:1 n=1 Tax=Scutellospora calospora TaxID=85575 RepID=A0ACA9L077_9GLOM|nr:223_t:CDS:2 [Scutellospora calospora]
MDNDDLLQVDEAEEVEMNDNTLALAIPELLSNKIQSKKCSFGSSCYIEVVAYEMFSKLFFQKFNRKKLSYDQKQKLNQLYMQSLLDK